MTKFTKTPKYNPGDMVAVDGVATDVLGTDTLVLHGISLSINEWIRRGRIRPATVAGFVTTYHLMDNPEKEGSQAGG